MITQAHGEGLFEMPAYSGTVAARYLRVPYQTVRYWMLGRRDIPPIAEPAGTSPLALSFANLLECHILNALRTRYGLHMAKVRSALDTLKQMTHETHPLLGASFKTDGVDLFVDRGVLLNVSEGAQYAIRDELEVYLERIEWHAEGFAKLYPFVVRKEPEEPRIVSINPAIASGRSVIDGTGISTAVIASRFWAREDPAELAHEYNRSQREIFEAIRWEGEYREEAA